MHGRKVEKEGLDHIVGKVVRVLGERGNWKVKEVVGEECICKKPYADVGERTEKFHYPRLFFAPDQCEGKVCALGCIEVPWSGADEVN